jgi:hypothetical protein
MDTQNINTHDASVNHDHNSEKLHRKEQDTAPAAPHLDPIYLAFFMMLEFANTQTKAVITQSNMLESNAAAQVRLTREQEAIQYVTFPKGLTGTDLEQQIPVIQAEDQQQQKLIDGIQNDEATQRQEATVISSELTTALNGSEQTYKQSTSLLSELLQITNVLLQ